MSKKIDYAIKHKHKSKELMNSIKNYIQDISDPTVIAKRTLDLYKLMNEKIKIAFLMTLWVLTYARLDAANLKSECIFLEFSSVDHTNYWDISNELKDNKITLFTDKPIIKKISQKFLLEWMNF